MTELPEGPALELGPVTKTYVSTPVLRDARLRLAFGEVHALLGGNGSGKSTMIKILAGVVPADPGGRLRVHGEELDLGRWSPAEARRLHLRFIHQDLGLLPDLTVAENLFVGARFNARRGFVSWRRLRRDATAVLERFDLALSPRTPVSELTLVQRTLLAAARAMYDVAPGERAVVVLDEPTAALPSAEADQLMQAIRRYAEDGHAMLVVTHRLGEVIDVGDRITVLRQGVVVHEGAMGTESESDLGRLITGVDARQEEALVEEALAEEALPEGEGVLPDDEAGSEGGLELSGVTTSAFARLDLRVGAGEIVGLVDAGGRAAPGVLRTLFGLERPTAGTMTLDGKTLRVRSPARAMARGIAYVPGQRLQEALFPGLSVGANITIAGLAAHRRMGLVDGGSERAVVTRAVREFSVHPADPDTEVTSLSGGNQQKVSVARWMTRRPSCLLLEEPTQGVDIGARAEIWALIAATSAGGAATVVVSSDYQELAAHCHRVHVFARGRLTKTLSGDTLTVPAIAGAVHDA